MKKVSELLGLKREAMLLDSRLYIIKAVIAIATGYIIGKSAPIARIDMISVLLGVMYNLEPINIIGVKGGLQQLAASTIGAACTSILIILFGINVYTVAISMALTLYVSLKINWRMVSPVAIFTCIYMTQFVQVDLSGNPSIWLTFRLRIVALGLGVLIAIIYNYVFSFFYYRKIAFKRLQYAKIQLVKGLEYTRGQLTNPGENKGRDYITLFPSIFNDLDLVYTNIETMINESRYSINFLQTERLMSIERILKYFRDVNHLAYDINFHISKEDKYTELDENILREIGKSIDILNSIDFVKRDELWKKPVLHEEFPSVNRNIKVYSNIELICSYISMVLDEAVKL